MGTWVITVGGKVTTQTAWSERDAIEQAFDSAGIDWQSGDDLVAEDIRPATVREALISEYGENWQRLLSPLVSVGERREYQRVQGRDGYPGYRSEVTEVLVISHARGHSMYGYDDALDVSNYRVLQESWGELDGWSDGPYSDADYASLDLDSEAPSDLLDVLSSLENYPVLDEDLMSQVEQEMIQEHWESYGKDDVYSAVEKAIDPDGETYGLSDAGKEIVDRLVWGGVLDYGDGGGYPTMIDSSYCDFGDEAIAAWFKARLGRRVTITTHNGYGERVTFDLRRQNLLDRGSCKPIIGTPEDIASVNNNLRRNR